jgi:hypothetical protein
MLLPSCHLSPGKASLNTITLPLERFIPQSLPSNFHTLLAAFIALKSVSDPALPSTSVPQCTSYPQVLLYVISSIVAVTNFMHSRTALHE